MIKDRNCQSCDNYKNEYCSVIDIKPHYPEKGCDYFSGKLAIEALEQESILDEIRSEIENHCGLAKENHCKYCSRCFSMMGVREILEIIDEYKTESEEKE